MLLFKVFHTLFSAKSDNIFVLFLKIISDGTAFQNPQIKEVVQRRNDKKCETYILHKMYYFCIESLPLVKHYKDFILIWGAGMLAFSSTSDIYMHKRIKRRNEINKNIYASVKE